MYSFPKIETKSLWLFIRSKTRRSATFGQKRAIVVLILPAETTRRTQWGIADPVTPQT
jgi:hypothetical protein